MARDSFSSRCMTLDDWAGVVHFTSEEFAHPEKMGFEFVMWLDQLRKRIGRRFIITSSYRTPLRNELVHGAKASAHCLVPCEAVDISVDKRQDDPNGNLFRWELVAQGILTGCKRFGLYANGSLHIDRAEYTHPAPRIWVVVDTPA